MRTLDGDASVWSDFSVGLSDFPNPTRSGAITRQPAETNGGDHLEVRVTPTRFTVQREHDRSINGTFVEVVDAQRSTLGVVDVDIVRRERITVEVVESFVGGAE
ncbi:MAG: hypothetical protein HRT86_01330 [Ilumatobacteraceae bacterium]|nr:hypothetical protein [Ilumatobacteraceae bacterium]